MSAAGVGRPDVSAAFVEAWDALDISNDDFIRTTEPRHHRARAEVPQAIHDNGYIYKDVYQGLVLRRAARTTTRRSELIDGQLPDPRPRLSRLEEENYFFQLSALRGPAARVLRATTPTPSPPRPSATRRSAFIKGGLRGHLDHAHVDLDWGVPVPWDDGARLLRLVRRADQLPHRHRLRRRPRRGSTRGGRPSHHLIGKDIIRFHCVWWPAMCMAAGLDPPAHVHVHGWLLVGGREDVQDDGRRTRSPHRHRAVVLTNDFGVDPLPLLPAARHRARATTATSPTRASRPLQRRPRQQPRQPAGPRVPTVVGTKCGGVGPAPDRLQSAASPWPPTSLHDDAAAWAEARSRTRRWRRRGA